MAKDKEYNQLIHTSRWLRLRKDILTEHPLCQRCEAKGLITAAIEVHHIQPVEEAYSTAERVSRMYDPYNLLALCHNCHVEVHTELGRCSKEANRKRQKKLSEEFLKKFIN